MSPTNINRLILSSTKNKKKLTKLKKSRNRSKYAVTTTRKRSTVKELTSYNNKEKYYRLNRNLKDKPETLSVKSTQTKSRQIPLVLSMTPQTQRLQKIQELQDLDLDIGMLRQRKSIMKERFKGQQTDKEVRKFFTNLEKEIGSVQKKEKKLLQELTTTSQKNYYVSDLIKKPLFTEKFDLAKKKKIQSIAYSAPKNFTNFLYRTFLAYKYSNILNYSEIEFDVLIIIDTEKEVHTLISPYTELLISDSADLDLTSKPFTVLFLNYDVFNANDGKEYRNFTEEIYSSYDVAYKFLKRNNSFAHQNILIIDNFNASIYLEY